MKCFWCHAPIEGGLFGNATAPFTLIEAKTGRTFIFDKQDCLRKLVNERAPGVD